MSKDKCCGKFVTKDKQCSSCPAKDDKKLRDKVRERLQGKKGGKKKKK